MEESDFNEVLSRKLGNKVSVQVIVNVLIDGISKVLSVVESTEGSNDVPALFVFEDIPKESISTSFFCFNNRNLGPCFEQSRYWVISTIYPMWCNMNVKMSCGCIELFNIVTPILQFETNTLRSLWSTLVVLSSTINHSIAHNFYPQDGCGNWLHIFAYKGNPNFRRLSLPFAQVNQHSISLQALQYSIGDDLTDHCSLDFDDSEHHNERMSLIHMDCVIPVYSRQENYKNRDSSSPTYSNVVIPNIQINSNYSSFNREQIIKKEIIKRIKKFLFVANLDTVRPIEVHNHISSLFSCYRENRCKYKSFVDENILICYGQMDEATLIIPNLYLGSEYNAVDIESLRNKQVKSIINVSTEIPEFFLDEFEYHRVFVDDLPEVLLDKYFDSTFRWIDTCLQQNISILVHCQLGVSRSASIVIAYLIRKNNWSYEQAYLFVKNRRKQVRPNVGFMSQLRQFASRIC